MKVRDSLRALELDCSGDLERVREALEDWKAEDYEEFLRACAAYLNEAERGALFECVLEVLGRDEQSLEYLLLHPERLSVGRASQILSWQRQRDGSYWGKLLGLLRQEAEQGAGALSGAEVLRLLEILGAQAEAAELMPILVHLCRHPDTRLRSKSVLLSNRMGRRKLAGVDGLADQDHRVRANAVEALWGGKDAETQKILQEAVQDAHHRVAANALVGLYRAGNVLALQKIPAMLRQADPHRRMAAAWVMGQTGDSRFLPCLEQVLPSSTGRTRSNLTKAIRSIEARRRRIEALPRLDLEVVRVDWGKKGRVYCGFACPEIGELLATQVLLHDGEMRVDALRLEPRGSREAAQVILVADARQEAEWVSWVEEMRRPEDGWGMLNYVGGSDWWPVLRQAAQSFSPEAPQRHLVLALRSGQSQDGGQSQDPERLEEWRKEAKAAGVQFHVLGEDLASEGEWERWQKMTWSLGGYALACEPGARGWRDGLARLLRGMAGGFDLTYELARLSPAAAGQRHPLRLEVFSDAGYGCLEVEPGAGRRLD